MAVAVAVVQQAPWVEEATADILLIIPEEAEEAEPMAVGEMV
jgi:hypothetical protein